jgi:stage II sporulation protein D
MNQWDIRRILKKAGLNKKGRIRNIYVTDRTSSNRVAELAFVADYGEEMMTAADFRRLAGYGKIQSTLFEVVKTPDGFHFEGYGNGHGVGMCQWAAKEMAQNGFEFSDILQFFYNGVKIRPFKG